MNRKDFLRSTLGTAMALTGMDTLAKNAGITGAPELSAPPAFTLPPLPYANSALEPHIDMLTMEIHHDRHHKAYVDNLNKEIDGKPLAKLTIEAILKDVSKHPVAVRNNGGGHYNHTFFWKHLSPSMSDRASGPVADAIDKAFGTELAFREAFAKAATARFGSGWVWLIVDKSKKLVISSTPNQDNPLMDVAEVKGIPVLGLDVWEHAYYLKYQNKRPDYVRAYWNVVNWNEVNKNYEAAMKG
ncbi:MAG: superoxide dismutase [Ferruginibacter sp.]|nr:superoxide dismutase [Cytophagales bacterium]